MSTPADPLKVRELILSKGFSLSQFGNKVAAACEILGMTPEEIRPFTHEGSSPPPDLQAEVDAFSRRYAAMTAQQQHVAMAQIHRHTKPLP